MLTLLVKGFPVLTGMAFVAAAAIHRGMLGDPGYTSHWLIGVEVALLLVLVVLMSVQGVSVVVLLFARKWGAMLLTAVLLIVTLVLFLVGLAIDSPTLLYAT